MPNTMLLQLIGYVTLILLIGVGITIIGCYWILDVSSTSIILIEGWIMLILGSFGSALLLLYIIYKWSRTLTFEAKIGSWTKEKKSSD